MSNALTSKGGRAWIQPHGPGHPVYLLSCKEASDLTETYQSIKPLLCHSNDGKSWDNVGQTVTPPEAVGFSLEGLVFEDKDWLEKVNCSFSLYALNRDCGDAGVFSNYVRGWIMGNVNKTSRKLSNLFQREEDTELIQGIDLEAWPPLIDINTMTVSRITTALTLAWNDIHGNQEQRCVGDCGETIDPGEELIVASDSAVGPGTADVPYSDDSGETWTTAAADPFGAGLHVMSGVRFYIGRDTVRWLVGQDAPAAAQGNLSYSDNGGATWTNVTIGGAAAGHGPVYGGGLWVNGERFVLLASAAGYIYKSTDSGETWTAVEAGTLTVGDYNQVKATYDNIYCIAGAPADVISLSDDGGESWYAAAATGGGGDILTVWRFDKNRMMVGTDDGTLYHSFDGGETWTQITGFFGSGAGDIRDLWFVNKHVGFMGYNTAVPVGHILRTINGGADWEQLTADGPTNSGINKVWAPTVDLCYAVGEANGGTSFVCKAVAV